MIGSWLQDGNNVQAVSPIDFMGTRCSKTGYGVDDVKSMVEDMGPRYQSRRRKVYRSTHIYIYIYIYKGIEGGASLKRIRQVFRSCCKCLRYSADHLG